MWVCQLKCIAFRVIDCQYSFINALTKLIYQITHEIRYWFVYQLKACCGYLKMQLHPSNCLGIAKFADSQSCLKLYQDAREFAYREFIQLKQHQEFLEMESKGKSLFLSFSA